MGRPKAWLTYDGEHFLPRVVRVLSVVVSPVVVAAAAGQDLPPLPAGVVVVRDEFAERGPLLGLLAGLKRIETEVAYVSACDVPLLRAAFVRRVVESLGDADAAAPEVGGRLQPLAAAYRVRPALLAIEGLLEQGRLAVRDVFTALRTNVVPAETLTAVDANLDSLKSVNTPDELAALRSSRS